VDGAPVPGPTEMSERPDRLLHLPSESIGHYAIQAVQRFAFPLLLALLIALFLLIQHWIDRKTPKLAFAPVHSKYDQIDFN
jgi:hypothetical protein